MPARSREAAAKPTCTGSVRGGIRIPYVDRSGHAKMTNVLTSAQAARILKCDPKTLVAMARKNRVKHFLVGNRFRFTEAAIAEYMGASNAK
jgi:excisionase family DNA binding protein